MVSPGRRSTTNAGIPRATPSVASATRAGTATPAAPAACSAAASVAMGVAVLSGAPLALEDEAPAAGVEGPRLAGRTAGEAHEAGDLLAEQRGQVLGEIAGHGACLVARAKRGAGARSG